LSGDLQLGCYGDEQFDVAAWQDDDKDHLLLEQHQWDGDDTAAAGAAGSFDDDDSGENEDGFEEPIGAAFGEDGSEHDNNGGAGSAEARAAAAHKDAQAGFTSTTRKVRMCVLTYVVQVKGSAV
jgi:hypothetical protein